jgi:hypothetical protein
MYTFSENGLALSNYADTGNVARMELAPCSNRAQQV